MAVLDNGINPVTHPQADAMLRDLKAAINTYNLRDERTGEAMVELLLQSIVRLAHALARVEHTCAVRHGGGGELDSKGNLNLSSTQLKTGNRLLDAMLSPEIPWPADDLL